jgi:uncharacterized membrane protein YsdA (DUF1294 family)
MTARRLTRKWAIKRMARRSPKQTFSLVAIGAVLLLGAVLSFFTRWNPIWIWLAAINLATFIMYGYDKSEAKSGGLRVPEVVLHGLALAGGFLGGWMGRYYFRHKTRKPVFTVVLIISTIIWLLVLYFLLF